MYSELFQDAEKRYSLPAGVLAAMAWKESSGIPWAARYEPEFFARYIANRPAKDLRGLWPRLVSGNTERNSRATSYGLLQVMGQVAREYGFAGIFLTQLCDPATGIEFGAKHLKRQLDRYKGDLAKALSAFNAGTATERNIETYVKPILAKMKE
jgi:hypothetical protein